MTKVADFPARRILGLMIKPPVAGAMKVNCAERSGGRSGNIFFAEATARQAESPPKRVLPCRQSSDGSTRNASPSGVSDARMSENAVVDTSHQPGVVRHIDPLRTCHSKYHAHLRKPRECHWLDRTHPSRYNRCTRTVHQDPLRVGLLSDAYRKKSLLGSHVVP